MSKISHNFLNKNVRHNLYLPFALDEIISGWVGLTRKMIKAIPEGFTRDEWAYLITFLNKSNLFMPFNMAFGDSTLDKEPPPDYLVKPLGQIGLWLPNNVSLLGPLMLVLLSLSGNTILMKGGSRSKNLTGIFLDYALTNLENGTLKEYLTKNISLDFFDHHDEKNHDMAMSSNVRIFFGSDVSANKIELLPHPIYSSGFYFIDMQSEAWIEADTIDTEVIKTLLKVFLVYGQAGCTSPKRVAIVNGSKYQAEELRSKMITLWDEFENTIPAQHIASENIMSSQLFSSQGWDVESVPLNKGVIPVGNSKVMPISLNTLPITWGPIDDIIDQLPSNIQTVGYSLLPQNHKNYLPLIASTGIKRFVPIGRMHHFGPVWDGFMFWNNLFEYTEVTV